MGKGNLEQAEMLAVVPSGLLTAVCVGGEGGGRTLFVFNLNV